MSELQQNTFQKRQVAYKIRISDILNSTFIKDGLSAGYIKLRDTNISRVNVIATVVYKSGVELNYASALIDDGTGKILLRGFENTNIFSKADVGDIVLIVGRIREFSNEKYIIPEILKRIESIEWMNVRKSELKNLNPIENENIKIENKIIVKGYASSIHEDIFSLIKSLDNGDGVSVDDVIKSSNNIKAESIINSLLENGDIFEIKPGKLKVLE